MAVYAIAQLTITDRTTYDRYQQRFMGVMKRFKGKVLAADENPQVVEGAWDRQKVVLLAKDRKAGSDAVILLVKGIG
jgi:uncharacterized protein (DUF1330 family)